ncbi:MAG: DNA repair protein RecO [Phycisphaeraceae bacterium]|nr:DNA repair protein RecO [Phycisphaeraceae bacterium]
MPRLTDNAICIRDLDWSESSQVVVLLTERHGKVRGLAKGSRRNSPSAIAKFSGGINLLSAGQAIVTTKPAEQLATVTEWDLRSDHYHLRTGLSAQWTAMYAADLVNALLADEDPHPGAYAALSRLLSDLAQADGVAQSLLRFQWALLVDVGYKPELEHDVETGQALPKAKAYSFDPKLGGLTTRNGMHDEDWRVRANTVELLRAISNGETTQAFTKNAMIRANRLLCTYFRALIDKQLPTMDFILNDNPNPVVKDRIRR